ncbi:MAG: hypothetical protein ACHQHP_01040, partial [Bacteroidia bacterium]
MKKLFQILFCLLLSFSAFAQENKDATIKKGSRWSLGICAAPNYSYRTTTSDVTDFLVCENPDAPSDQQNYSSYRYKNKFDKGLDTNVRGILGEDLWAHIDPNGLTKESGKEVT